MKSDQRVNKVIILQKLKGDRLEVKKVYLLNYLPNQLIDLKKCRSREEVFCML